MSKNQFFFDGKHIQDGDPFLAFDTPLFTEGTLHSDSPGLYHIVMLNDNDTPLDFVISVLQAFFYLSLESATALALKIHQDEMAVCGTYPRDVAETKINQLHHYSIKHKHSLKCVLQKEITYAFKKS